MVSKTHRRLVLITWCIVALALVPAIWLGGNGASAFPAAQDPAGGKPASAPAQQQQQQSNDPITSFDCSMMEELGIDKQMNLRAGMIMDYCSGKRTSKPQSNPKAPSVIESLVAPLAYGGTDRQLITGADTAPNVTQSESWVWGNGNTIVVTFNDSRGVGASPVQLSGISVSNDGGVTWTRLNPSPFTGLGNNYGDPFHWYSVRAGKWYYGSFAANGACGGQGIGQWESTNPNALTWAASGCIHNGSNDDRFSGWVDNNPASPFYGRQYVSWNDFNVGGGAIFATFSTDDGVTWSTPTNVFGSFRRNGQMSGSLGTDGTVFIQTMDEGGGGLGGPRQNYIYRSTNGGVNWTQIQQNAATFLGPGRGTCGYFAGMYTTPVNGYWRHMGYGQPGVGPNNVVHYAYADRAGADPGNIKYIRSTDNGSTWSAPIQLNTDSTTRAQWQPSLAVNATGLVFVGWYDERNTTGDNYQRFGRASTDNGVTWQADEAVSDPVSIPKPLQLDPGMQPCYAGDYDYAMFSRNGQGVEALHTWVDGRNLIGGNPQQDVYFDKIIPACGATSDYFIASTSGVNIVAGTTDIGNHADDLITNVALPFSFTFYGVAFASANVSSNGNLQFTSADASFNNACLPAASMNNLIAPHWDDLRTDAQPNCSAYPGSLCGIFTSTSGTAPNRIFNIEWRTVLFASGATVHFEVRLHENQSRIDFIYGFVNGSGAGATVGVQRGTTGPQFSQHSCNTAAVSFGMMLSFTQFPCPTSTPTPTRTITHTFTPTRTSTPTFTPTRTFTSTSTHTSTPTNTHTPTSTPTVPACGNDSNYAPITNTIALVAATNLVPGSQCDDCFVNIALPFTYNFYNQALTSVNLVSNGNAQFSSSDATFTNTCLPVGIFNNAILPHWDDLRTDAQTGCSGYPGGTCGIYTSTLGVAPNRTFIIEWRSVYFSNVALRTNFEIKLYENAAPGVTAFDFVYGQLDQGGSSATIGVQKGTGSHWTQYSCDTTGITSSLLISWRQPPCVTPTFTPTITPTPTNTPTNTFTFTPTQTPTNTPTNTVVVATPVLVGHVIWQGRPAQPNGLQALPITLTLKLGAVESNFSGLTTDASGFFTVGVGALPNGVYDWRVKGPDGSPKALPTDPPGFLSNCGTVALAGALQTDMENSQVFPGIPGCTVAPGCVRAGDANNDDIESIVDFNIVKNTFGKSSIDVGYDNRADFDGTTIVSITDFNLLKNNFGTAGCSPIMLGYKKIR